LLSERNLSRGQETTCKRLTILSMTVLEPRNNIPEANLDRKRSGGLV
jgi:hypothetical protein